MDNNMDNIPVAAGSQTTPSAKYYAIGGMVLGVLSLALLLFNQLFSLFSLSGALVYAIVGAVLSNKAKKIGGSSSVATAGLITSVIGIVVNSLSFVSVLCVGGCAACIVCTSAGMLAGMA